MQSTNKNNNILHFAYGSNMSTNRIQERIPSAQYIGIAVLKNYEFICNKKSKDGSSKGNIYPLKGAQTWGVVFKIPNYVVPILDRTEGGYTRITVTVFVGDLEIKSETYISQKISTEPPYDWYLKYIIDGAREHRLPDEYIQTLSRIKTKKEEVGP